MDAKKAWSPIHELFANKYDVFDAGVKAAEGESKTLSAALLEAGALPTPPVADVEREAARYALVTPWFSGKSRVDEAVTFVYALGGAKFALEVILASLRYERKTPGEYNDSALWVAPLARAQEISDFEPWMHLRGFLEKASAKEKKEVHEYALELAPKASKVLRAMLAYLVPDEPSFWTDRDSAQGLVETNATYSRMVSFILAELRHAKIESDAQRWLPVSPSDIGGALEKDAAVPSLRMLLHWGEWEAADALASIETALSMRVLAELAQQRRVLPVFARAVHRNPALAIDAIAPMFEAKKGGEKRARLSLIARAHLVAAVAANPELAKKAPALAKDAGVLAPIARELPEILRVPPWKMAKEKKASAKAKKEEPRALELLPYEERMDWGKRDPKDLFTLDIEPERERETMKRARVEAKNERAFLLYINWLADENAWALLREIPAEKWYGQEDDVEEILARFGLEALDVMLAFAKKKPDVSKAFLVVDSPRVAPHMAHVFSNNKKMKAAAGEWLLKYPRAAAIGLFPQLAQTSGKARAAIEEAIRHVSTKHAKIVKEVSAEYGTGEVKPKESQVERIREPKLPKFFDAKSLPRPILKDGTALDADAISDFAKLLVVSKLEEPHPGVVEVKDACEPSSLARFAFGLFIQWLAADGPSKDGWAFRALGFFGDAESARTLGPMAKDWAPGGLPQRAQAAVDVLAAMGHDAATLAVHNLSNVRSKALARHAGETMTKIAKARGLTAEELADRLVPDLGLEQDGTMTFDFGSRRFTLGFGDDLAPFVRMQSGDVLADLPKPSKNDDEELAASAVESWKDLKKSARKIASEQSRRLEIAMTTRRRFSLEHFETFFSRHAFMQHLARRLLWATYGSKASPFRVAEDGSYANDRDEEIDLDPDARIGVVHPLDLDTKQLAKWGEIFGSYEIVQPFEQLSRQTYEKKMDFIGKTIATAKVLGLRRSGWKEGATEQGGYVSLFTREASGQRAMMLLDPGVYLGDPSMNPEQRIERLEFLVDEERADEIDPILLSEVTRDLSALD